MPTQPLPIVPGITANVPPNFFNVAASTGSIVLAPANADRTMITIFNDSTSPLYVRYGMIATSSLFNVKVPSQGYFEFPLPIFLADINGHWDTATGFAKVTEFI